MKKRRPGGLVGETAGDALRGALGLFPISKD
jgi:hypothetical protein